MRSNLLREKQKGSKVYVPNAQSIAMNNDSSHQKVNDQKVEEAKHVQEKKQIDKILHSIVKQRMFGNLLSEESRLSNGVYSNLDKICKINHGNTTNLRSFHQYSTIAHEFSEELNGNRTERKSKMNSHWETPLRSMHTIDHNATFSLHQNSKRLNRGNEGLSSFTIKHPSRGFSQKLPKIQKSLTKNNEGSFSPRTKQINLPHHLKRLQIQEKSLHELYRKMAGNPNAMIFDVKLTRENIYNRCKQFMDVKLMERFLIFFGFPITMGYRQYCTFIENAVNCNLKFIYFFVFSLLDESANGFLTVSDIFRFMQRFPQNLYLEEQIYLIAKQIGRVTKELQKIQNHEIQPLVEEMLIVNHNIRLEQLIDLLKQSNKGKISVDCVKSTCYHQTVLSLEHDQLMRLKQDQIQDTEQASKKNKQQGEVSKTVYQDGIRLRDFYPLFGHRRPKIFCLFINVLTGRNGSDYE